MPTARPRPGPGRLVLVRHAESLGNVADRDARSRGDARLDLHVRDADVALSPTGKEQAAAVGRFVATLPADEQPTVVLASPYERAAATAAHALSAMDGRLQVRLDERLRERELGIFDGLTGAGISDRVPARGGPAPLPRQVLLPAPVRRELVRRRAAGPQPPARRGGPVRRRAGVGLQPPGGDHELPAGARGAAESARSSTWTPRSPMANCSMTSYLRGPDGALELESYADATAVQDSCHPDDA